MHNLNVLIKIQNDNIWMQYNNKWVPLNSKLMEGFNLSLMQVIKLKLIELELEDYSKR